MKGMNSLPFSGLLLLALGLLFVHPPPARADAVPVHDLRIRIDPARATLEGEDRLRLPEGVAGQLTLHLAPSLQVRQVALAGKKLPYRRTDRRLEILLPGQASGGPRDLIISYEGKLDDPVPQDPVRHEDPSFGVDAAITPQGAFLGAGAGWYPELPVSEARFRLRVETPSGWLGVSSGRRVESGEAAPGWSFVLWETERPLPAIALSAGPYQVREARAGSIPVFTYFYEANAHLAESYLNRCRDYLASYQKLFGPYPFEKFAVVENFFPTGYGYPSWTLLGSSVVRLPFIVETSLGHEIAHSWWGTGVPVASGTGNWSEGLTTYVADHLFRELAGEAEGEEYRQKILRDYATLVKPKVDFPLSAFRHRRSAAEQAVGYGKGAMVFHMTRRLIGEETFWEALRQLAQERMGAATSWSDIAETFSRTSGRDLAPCFAQWLRRPGAPRMTLKEVSAKATDGGWEVTGILEQEPPLYDLTLPLALTGTGGEITEISLPVKGARTPFLLASAEPPRELVVDPRIDIFRRLDPSEVPTTVNSLRGSSTLVALVAEDFPPEALPTARLLLSGLGQDKAPLLKEGQADPSALSGHDLLYLGWPRRQTLRPLLPPGVEVDTDAFTLSGLTFGSATDALFVTLLHPWGQARSAALFFPLSPLAAEPAARKIPHYGKYSYLSFSAGANRIKGTWPPPVSPTRHIFEPPKEAP